MPSLYLHMSFRKEGVAQLFTRTHEKKKENFQDLELFLIGPNNSSIPIGGRLGLISHGIATLAVLKQPMFVVNILSLALVFPQNWSLFPRIDTHILI